METWQKVLIGALATVVVAFAAFATGYGLASRKVEPQTIELDEPGSGLRVIRDAYDKIRESAVEQPGEEALARGAVRGMVKVLKTETDDPYALFYGPQGYESFQELTSGKFSGIGVWLKPVDDELRIVSVLPNTPALEAGLAPDDVIRTIDGDAVRGMPVDEAVARIKGPEGTEVKLEIARGDEELSFTITRDQIDLPAVRSSLAGGDVGYVRLLTFSKGVGHDVRAEVERLSDEGAEGIVLDMRDNGGGLFTEAIDVASVFIENGVVVTYKERSEPPLVYEAEGDAFEDIPIVVLVNEGTASASEIVAGALQDRERGVVVGKTTFGKGSVQRLIQLLDGSALKLTTAAYLTPGGASIDGKGIEPDVEVNDNVETDPDEQRHRAIEILRGIVLSSNPSKG